MKPDGSLDEEEKKQLFSESSLVRAAVLEKMYRKKKREQILHVEIVGVVR